MHEGQRPTRAPAAALLCSLLVTAAGLPAFADPLAPAGQAAVPIRIELGENDPAVSRLTRLGIDLDGVFEGWARAYVIPEERDKLERLGYRVSDLPDEGKIGLARLESEGPAGGIGESNRQSRSELRQPSIQRGRQLAQSPDTGPHGQRVSRQGSGLIDRPYG